MANNVVAAAALPVTTATGDVPYEFLDWVVYDAASGQLINTATDQVMTCCHERRWQ